MTGQESTVPTGRPTKSLRQKQIITTLALSSAGAILLGMSSIISLPRSKNGIFIQKTQGVLQSPQSSTSQSKPIRPAQIAAEQALHDLKAPELIDSGFWGPVDLNEERLTQFISQGSVDDNEDQIVKNFIQVLFADKPNMLVNLWRISWSKLLEQNNSPFSHENPIHAKDNEKIVLTPKDAMNLFLTSMASPVLRYQMLLDIYICLLGFEHALGAKIMEDETTDINLTPSILSDYSRVTQSTAGLLCSGMARSHATDDTKTHQWERSCRRHVATLKAYIDSPQGRKVDAMVLKGLGKLEAFFNAGELQTFFPDRQMIQWFLHLMFSHMKAIQNFPFETPAARLPKRSSEKIVTEPVICETFLGGSLIELLQKLIFQGQSNSDVLEPFFHFAFQGHYNHVPAASCVDLTKTANFIEENSVNYLYQAKENFNKQLEVTQQPDEDLEPSKRLHHIKERARQANIMLDISPPALPITSLSAVVQSQTSRHSIPFDNPATSPTTQSRREHLLHFIPTLAEHFPVPIADLITVYRACELQYQNPVYLNLLKEIFADFVENPDTFVENLALILPMLLLVYPEGQVIPLFLRTVQDQRQISAEILKMVYDILADSSKESDLRANIIATQLKSKHEDLYRINTELFTIAGFDADNNHIQPNWFANHQKTLLKVLAALPPITDQLLSNVDSLFQRAHLRFKNSYDPAPLSRRLLDILKTEISPRFDSKNAQLPDQTTLVTAVAHLTTTNPSTTVDDLRNQDIHSQVWELLTQSLLPHRQFSITIAKQLRIVYSSVPTPSLSVSGQMRAIYQEWYGSPNGHDIVVALTYAMRVQNFIEPPIKSLIPQGHPKEHSNPAPFKLNPNQRFLLKFNNDIFGHFYPADQPMHTRYFHFLCAQTLDDLASSILTPELQAAPNPEMVKSQISSLCTRGLEFTEQLYVEMRNLDAAQKPSPGLIYNSLESKTFSYQPHSTKSQKVQSEHPKSIMLLPDIPLSEALNTLYLDADNAKYLDKVCPHMLGWIKSISKSIDLKKPEQLSQLRQIITSVLQGRVAETSFFRIRAILEDYTDRNLASSQSFPFPDTGNLPQDDVKILIEYFIIFSDTLEQVKPSALFKRAEQLTSIPKNAQGLIHLLRALPTSHLLQLDQRLTGSDTLDLTKIHFVSKLFPQMKRHILKKYYLNWTSPDNKQLCPRDSFARYALPYFQAYPDLESARVGVLKIFRQNAIFHGGEGAVVAAIQAQSQGDQVKSFVGSDESFAITRRELKLIKTDANVDLFFQLLRSHHTTKKDQSLFDQYLATIRKFSPDHLQQYAKLCRLKDDTTVLRGFSHISGLGEDLMRQITIYADQDLFKTLFQIPFVPSAETYKYSDQIMQLGHLCQLPIPENAIPQSLVKSFEKSHMDASHDWEQEFRFLYVFLASLLFEHRPFAYLVESALSQALYDYSHQESVVSNLKSHAPGKVTVSPLSPDQAGILSMVTLAAPRLRTFAQDLIKHLNLQSRETLWNIFRDCMDCSPATWIMCAPFGATATARDPPATNIAANAQFFKLHDQFIRLHNPILTSMSSLPLGSTIDVETWSSQGLTDPGPRPVYGMMLRNSFSDLQTTVFEINSGEKDEKKLALIVNALLTTLRSSLLTRFHPAVE